MNDWMILAGLAALSAVVVLVAGVALPARLRLAGFVDLPNDRSSHVTATPRGGGIVIAVLLAATAAVLAAWTRQTWCMVLTLGIGAVASISLLDDWRSVAWKWRLMVQMASAALLIGSLLFVHSPVSPLELMMAGVALVFVVGYANAFNFMDGINGLAAGQSLVTASGSFLIALTWGVPSSHPALVLVAVAGGAALGFLPHNFPIARMFMGDSGSVVLGFAYAAVIVILGFGHGLILAAILSGLHANFILDTMVTMFRRWRRGETIHQAHREHFYQRLVRSGASHVQVTLLELGLQLVVIMVLVAAAKIRGVAGLFAAGLLVSAVWAAFFVWVEHRFRTVNR
jgi:UDP-N-acetylmuramyl pentapeptide phosphotransferase/UDP-N-acetylglucosamine-1-phosphate transferase